MPAAAARPSRPQPPPAVRARAAAAQARTRQLRPRGHRRDPRRGPDRPPRHRRRGRPAVRDPHAARSQRRSRLLPRVDGQPHAARARGGRAGVPDRVADRRARARPLGDAPLGQLPLGDAARARRAACEDATRSARRCEAIVEHIVPGRWRDVRAPTRQRAEGDVGARDPDRGGLGEGPQRRTAGRRGGLRAAGVGGRDPAGHRGAHARARPAAARRHRAAGLRHRYRRPGGP